MKKSLCISTFLITLCTIRLQDGYSQNRQIDSLKRIAAIAKTDSDKIRALTDLSSRLAQVHDSIAWLSVTNQALALSKTSGLKYWEAQTYLEMAYDCAFFGPSLNNMMINFLNGLRIAEKENYDDIKMYAYAGISEIYHSIGDDKEALNYYSLSLKACKKTKNRSQEAQVLTRMSWVQYSLKSYDDAFQSLNEAREINLQLGKESNRLDVIAMYESLGMLFQAEGDQALSNHDQSLAKKDFLASMNYYDTARPLIEKRHSEWVTGQFCIYLGELYTSLKNYSLAEKYINQGLKLLAGTDDVDEIEAGYKTESVIDSVKGNYRKAYKDINSYLLLRDSLETNKSKNTITSYLMQYALEKANELAKSEQEKKETEQKRLRNKQYFIIGILAIMGFAVLVLALVQYRNNNHRKRANKLLYREKEKVESALAELKSTQSQLIQSEKMASLGELTAGIAHEIQNPLNFVNNFSEVSNELIGEMVEEVDKGNTTEVKTIAENIKQNLEKINHHGKRADAIVKGMLQHSRSSVGAKEPTDINAVADEYLRLSYHGLRAKDNSFNATMKTDFDNSIGKINIIPQDIGRVLLNLYNNAFYAVNEKKVSTSSAQQTYEPAIFVSTKKSGNQIFITVSDNGNGIPQKVVDKIFQPFFTTKPTGQGTGLGLSLSYDIVKAHGGEIKVNSKELEGSEFIIELPLK